MINLSIVQSRKTKEGYARYILVSFVCEAKSLDDVLLREPKPLNDDVIKFLVYLRNGQQVSYRYRRTSLSSKIFEMNDIILPWIQIPKFIGQMDLSILARQHPSDMDTGYMTVQGNQLHFINVMIVDIIIIVNGMSTTRSHYLRS